MEASQAADPKVLAHYEGLVRKTAGKYAGVLEDDFEDICQVLRIKVWKALLSFDPRRSRLGRDAYVFGCVRNQVKDLLKRRRDNNLFIEDFTGNSGHGSSGKDSPSDSGSDSKFEFRYLVSHEEQVFAEVLDDDTLIPSTLTEGERKVLVCMYLEYTQAEMALKLGASRKEVATAVKNIRIKMEDWRPTPVTVEQPQRVAA